MSFVINYFRDDTSCILFDRKADKLPVISNLVNLYDLFQKAILDCFKVSDNEDKKYYCYLKDKSYLRCLSLTINPIGFIFIAIYDKYIKKESIIELKDARINTHKDNLEIKTTKQFNSFEEYKKSIEVFISYMPDRTCVEYEGSDETCYCIYKDENGNIITIEMNESSDDESQASGSDDESQVSDSEAESQASDGDKFKDYFKCTFITPLDPFID